MKIPAISSSMGNIALVLAILVGILAFLQILNKLRVYAGARSETRRWAPALQGALRDRANIPEAIEISHQYPRSHLARVVAVGLEEFQENRSAGRSPTQIIQRSERAMNRVMEIVNIEFKSGVAMKVVAGVTPALAVFKSPQAAIVLGIIFVAPAAWFAIFSEHRCNAFSIEMKNSISEVLDYLENVLSPHHLNDDPGGRL